jgi:putative FmdB family regulatory protein
MPIYEYRCSGCGNEFEKYLAGHVRSVACPRCQSAQVTRRLSLVTLKTHARPAPAGGAAGGGCCGGGCGCH